MTTGFLPVALRAALCAFKIAPGDFVPIYKQALDVAVYFERAVAGFSRYHKYTLGTELRNQSREIVGRVIRANSARDKQPELLMLRERLEALLVTMRIAKEVQAFKRLVETNPATETGPVPRVAPQVPRAFGKHDDTGRDTRLGFPPGGPLAGAD